MALPYCACYFIITLQCHEIDHEFIRYWKWLCSLLVVGWFFALPNCALLRLMSFLVFIYPNGSQLMLFRLFWKLKCVGFLPYLIYVKKDIASGYIGSERAYSF